MLRQIKYGMAPCRRAKQKLPVQALRGLRPAVAIHYLRVLFCTTRVAVAVAVAAIWPVPLENQLTIGNKFSLYHVLSLREAVTKCLYVCGTKSRDRPTPSECFL